MDGVLATVVKPPEMGKEGLTNLCVCVCSPNVCMHVYKEDYRHQIYPI
jgi:hypothetical protein